MNYPKGIKVNKNHVTTYSNRGMLLEDDINISNNYYIDKSIAYIYKKPTPIKIVKVDYKIKRITEAYYEMPSTTDYNGLYKGYYIDFEAKETNNKTVFPIENIHSHQIKHLKNIYENKGISFIIVRFNRLNQTFLLFTKDLLNFINNNERKSIPIDFFLKHGYLIKDNYQPRIDYIKIIDMILEENNE